MEIWKDIKGYKGTYKVSNQGRVKSLERKIPGKNNSIRTSKEIILKQSEGTYGYYQVCLTKNSKKKTHRIHQLVAEAFLNHTRCGYEKVIDHIDHNYKNNKVSNLQLISHRENTSKDKFRKKESSNYIGVYPHKNKWRSKIYVNGKQEHLGLFENEKEAYSAYKKRLNEIRDV